MGDFEAVGDRLRDNREIVVLARYLHLACRQVLHRVVAAVVPELETSSLRPACEREQLVPKANSHDRDGGFFDRINMVYRIVGFVQSC